MVARGQAVSPSQEMIFLDPDDDLGTVRAKLESSPADQIFLVLPGRAATLRTPLEFRILARIAHELSTDVVIVSSDAARRQMARREGLRSRRRHGGVRQLAGSPVGASGWLPSIPDWVPLPSLKAVIVLTVLVSIIGIFALVALPVMRVTVTPVSENVQREVELLVDPNVKVADPSKALLPGEQLQYRFETAGSVPTSAQKNVGRDPARGEVVFNN